MKIVIIQGSTREQSQSHKVAVRLQEKMSLTGNSVEFIDLFELQLPVYDDSGQSEWEPVADRLNDADAFVLVCPEWNGSASPGMMNFLTYTSVGKQKPLAHRPAVIVSVSSGAGGSYPISQLKAYGNKNNHPVFIPEHLRIRDVKKVLNTKDADENNQVDVTLHTRMEHMINVLLAYAGKLGEIRAAGIPDLKTYANGN